MVSPEAQKASIRRIRSNNPETEYVALSDYQMQIGQKNVSISQGSPFEVIEKAPNGWSFIKIGIEEGWVPSSMIERRRKNEDTITEESEDIYENVKTAALEKVTSIDIKEVAVEENNNNIDTEKCITIGNYVSSDASGINFKEGDIVEVLEKNKSGWWFIKIGAEEGWAPSTYLSPIAKKKVIASAVDQSAGQLDIAVPPPKPNRKSEIPQSYENNSLNKDRKVGKSKTPSPVASLAVKPERPASPKSPAISRGVSPVPKPRVSPGPGMQLGDLKVAINRAISPKPQPRSLANTERGKSVDEYSKTPPMKPKVARGRKISEPAKPFRPAQPEATRKTSPGVSAMLRTRVSPPIPERPKLEALDMYVTESAYKDDDEGMLSFDAGEKVQVLEKDDGGWWLARIGIKQGWVPSNFLKKE